MEECSKPGFWEFIRMGEIEEHMHPEKPVEGQRADRAEGVRPEPEERW